MIDSSDWLVIGWVGVSTASSHDCYRALALNTQDGTVHIRGILNSVWKRASIFKSILWLRWRKECPQQI